MILKFMTGLVAVGALAASLVWASDIPVHTPGSAEVFRSTVTPARQNVACPNPLEIPVGSISSGDADLDSGSDDVKREVFTAGSRDDLRDGLSSDALAAATLERVGGGDIAGLAAASCALPQLDQWLVGGATTLGASARLVLSNPSDAPVEVSVTSYGLLGESDDPMTVVVGPLSQESLLLEGTIAETPALVLHLAATGTGVTAHLQDSRLDGFEPAGTDWVGAGDPPANTTVIPAVGLSDPTADASTAVVSLLAPDGATATLVLVTEDGIVDWPGTSGLVLDPGVVTEIPVPAVAAGAIEVRADAPVVAAALSRVSRDSQVGREGVLASDLMWVAGQSDSDARRTLIALTDDPTLFVYSATHQGVTVTNQDGDVVAKQDIAARTIVLLTVDATAGDELTVPAGFAWAQVVSDDDGYMTAVGPTDTEVRDLEVAVTVGGYVPVP